MGNAASRLRHRVERRRGDDFFVDRTQYWTVTPSMLPAGATWVFDQPFFVLLNFAVGGGWPGNPDGSATFPQQQMVVDYVRAYRQ